MLVEELGQSLHQRQLGDVDQREPGRFGGVIAGDGRPVVQHGDPEIHDHVVVVGPDAFDPADQVVAHRLHAGFLGQLPYHRFGQRLPRFDPAAGHRPLPRGRAPAPPHQQDAVVLDGHRTHADLRARHRGGGARPTCGR